MGTKDGDASLRIHHLSDLTPRKDVKTILARLTDGAQSILGDKLIGLYLTGSLTYGDFDPGSSDIDYLALLHRAMTPEEREELRSLHAGISNDYPVWAERIEGSYITADMLDSIEPPEQPRPYVNGGAFWDPDPSYGNEWLINLYALYHCGVALVGPNFKDLIGPVNIELVREASRRDLLDEWVPKLGDAAFFENSHHQAYLTLTLCRILYRAFNDGVVSKRVAAAWVKETYGEPWIVERAEGWQHGDDLDASEQVEAFIRFARDQLTS